MAHATRGIARTGQRVVLVSATAVPPRLPDGPRKALRGSPARQGVTRRDEVGAMESASSMIARNSRQVPHCHRPIVVPGHQERARPRRPRGPRLCATGASRRDRRRRCAAARSSRCAGRPPRCSVRAHREPDRGLRERARAGTRRSPHPRCGAIDPHPPTRRGLPAKAMLSTGWSTSAMRPRGRQRADRRHHDRPDLAPDRGEAPPSATERDRRRFLRDGDARIASPVAASQQARIRVSERAHQQPSAVRRPRHVADLSRRAGSSLATWPVSTR